MNRFLLSMIVWTSPAAVSDLPSVVPGFRWNCGSAIYQVLTVDGDYVRYYCVSDPTLVHPPCDGATEKNQQSIARTLAEAGLKK